MIAVEQLGAPAWLQSLANDGVAMLSSTLTGVAAALTSSRSRAFAVRLGAVLLLAWLASMAAVYAVPSAWLAVALFGSALIFGVGTVVLGTRMNAAASEAAPPGTGWTLPRGVPVLIQRRQPHRASSDVGFRVVGLVAVGATRIGARGGARTASVATSRAAAPCARSRSRRD